jgi:hypothetical protein
MESKPNKGSGILYIYIKTYTYVFYSMYSIRTTHFLLEFLSNLKAELIILPLRILETRVQISSRRPVILTKTCRNLPQYIHENIRIISQLTLLLFPFKSFKIHYSPIIILEAI